MAAHSATSRRENLPGRRSTVSAPWASVFVTHAGIEPEFLSRTGDHYRNTAAAARFLTGSGGPDLLTLRAPDNCCNRRLLPPNADAIRREIEARMAAG